uniref:Uncharacterized protein n=1 Tax=Peronospora matthiolae TaxID=2874970 RepID=A0AAV1URF3_9STRA
MDVPGAHILASDFAEASADPTDADPSRSRSPVVVIGLTARGARVADQTRQKLSQSPVNGCTPTPPDYDIRGRRCQHNVQRRVADPRTLKPRRALSPQALQSRGSETDRTWNDFI